MRLYRLIFAALQIPAMAWAQSLPSFDVASIKPQPWEGTGGVGVFLRGNTLAAEHVALYDLVEFAYDLRDENLSGGPSWTRHGSLATSNLYQVIAKTAGDPLPSKDQFRLMLQTLLAERFQLKVHHVPKTLPTYNLVIARQGSKLRASPADAKFSMQVDAALNGGKSVRITAAHAQIAQLLGHLERNAGRPLFDHTALAGFYDFVLEWDRDSAGPAVPDGLASDLIGASFFTALEKQLGLKLESSTASFDTVVIDHAEKPAQN